MRLLLKVRDSERAKYPQLVKLIIQSDDMDWNRERQYWLDRLEGFTAKQAQQLELELTESEKLIANVKQAFFATTIMTYPFLDWKDKTLSLYWNVRVIWTDYIARLRAAAKQMVDKERWSEVS